MVWNMVGVLLAAPRGIRGSDVADVADLTLGAKYQAELTEEMGKVYQEHLIFYLKAIMQDGFLPGTEPPKTVREEVALGWPRAVELIQRVQMGDQLTVREQRFLIDWLEAGRNLNGSKG